MRPTWFYDDIYVPPKLQDQENEAARAENRPSVSVTDENYPADSKMGEYPPPRVHLTAWRPILTERLRNEVAVEYIEVEAEDSALPPRSAVQIEQYPTVFTRNDVRTTTTTGARINIPPLPR